VDPVVGAGLGNDVLLITDGRFSRAAWGAGVGLADQGRAVCG
jgi:dihydroxyacid dehydratase/phosphogluconate dehydratase